MTEAGRAKINFVIFGEKPQAKQGKGDLDIPGVIKKALMANAKAWKNFRNLAPSKRRGYIQWIMDVKKVDARAAAPGSRRALGAEQGRPG